MCPLCRDKPCKVLERPDGRLACECGRHSWPNAAAFSETIRLENLTIVKAVHHWTQSF